MVVASDEGPTTDAEPGDSLGPMAGDRGVRCNDHGDGGRRAAGGQLSACDREQRTGRMIHEGHRRHRRPVRSATRSRDRCLCQPRDNRHGAAVGLRGGARCPGPPLRLWRRHLLRARCRVDGGVGGRVHGFLDSHLRLCHARCVMALQTVISATTGDRLKSEAPVDGGSATRATYLRWRSR